MSGSRLIVSLIGAVLALWGLVVYGQSQYPAGADAPPAATAGDDRYPAFAAVGADGGGAAAADPELTRQGRTLGLGILAGGVLIAAVPWLGRRRTG
ncbi:hypothetical protein C3486_34540 [Streptomyces sp. Ru73]|uniref:hypothetical protein n=1 Tax=Streptomyces sp. Ru73 TaxID=2080748 RepID=UPI000CDE0276|nr:hypothetical protein [Streptomyces sp. Ru73]POX36259.1 hypothetical protein C3486_34540 [Streptomyces sp. Ru73]